MSNAVRPTDAKAQEAEVPVARSLTPAEVASYKALMQAALQVERPTAPFDAVQLVAEGRR